MVSADGIILSGTATDGALQVFRDGPGEPRGPVIMLAPDTASKLKQTPLYRLHLARGGKMVPFAGYDMPVQYPTGVLKEHLQTRAHAGLFDVSHMRQIALRARSGKVEDAALALEQLVPQHILALPPGRHRYAQFTNENGRLHAEAMGGKL